MSQHVTFLDVIPVRILFSSMVRLGFLKYFLRDLFPHSRTSIPANIRLDKEMLKTSLRSLERNSFFVFPEKNLLHFIMTTTHNRFVISLELLEFSYVLHHCNVKGFLCIHMALPNACAPKRRLEICFDWLQHGAIIETVL